MSFIQDLQNLFNKWGQDNQLCATTLTLLTCFGIAATTVSLLVICYKTIQGFRLYIWSQFCSQTDLRQRYGKWAMVTGATDGIGLELCRELARRGHSIVMLGRDEDKLLANKILVEHEAAAEVEVVTVTLDLSDANVANYERAMAQIDPDSREIGILINNAGVFIQKYAVLHKLDLQLDLNMLNVHCLATVYLTKYLIPSMLTRRKGLIVNVSSTYATVDGVYIGTYGATKAYVDYVTRQLQTEYSNTPLDFICLRPGGVFTKFMKPTRFTSASFLNPKPKRYAYHAINCMSTRIQIISGYWMHAIMSQLLIVLGWLGLSKFAVRTAFWVAADEPDIEI